MIKQIIGMTTYLRCVVRVTAGLILIEIIGGITLSTKVVHVKKERYDIYIGRPTKWGNPFTIGKDGDREDVINKYRHYIFDRLRNEPELMEELVSFDGLTLGCWCAPKPCHGDVLVDIIKGETWLRRYARGEV